jgi:hypothetical protein
MVPVSEHGSLALINVSAAHRFTYTYRGTLDPHLVGQPCQALQSHPPDHALAVFACGCRQFVEVGHLVSAVAGAG